MGVFAAAGYADLRPVASTPALGVFLTSMLRFDYPDRLSPAEGGGPVPPGAGGQRVALTAVFALSCDVRAGESVFLTVPELSRAAGGESGDSVDLYVAHWLRNLTAAGGESELLPDAEDSGGVYGAYVHATWNEGTAQLTLTTAEDVPALQTHAVRLSAAAGLRLLPSAGPFASADPRRTIGTNATAGPNSGTPLHASPPLPRTCGVECAVWNLRGTGCQCLPQVVAR
jgi:hypothetical protein